VKSREFADNSDVQKEYNQALVGISGIKFDTYSPNQSSTQAYPSQFPQNHSYNFNAIPQQQQYYTNPTNTSDTSSWAQSSPLSDIGTRKNPLFVMQGQENAFWKWIGQLIGSLFLLWIVYTYFFKSAVGGGASPLAQFNQEGQFKPIYNTGKKFEDVKGIDECLEEITDLSEFLKHPEKFNTLGGKLPRGVLLVGPPGTGKTLLAKAIAGEAGVPFFFASGSEFDEMFVGVGAKRVRALFEAARKNSPCIVFIDEIDAIGGKRTIRDGNYARQTLNQLLAEMDGFKENEAIIIIGATNLVETMDNALLRPGRFDKHVEVPLPNVSGRKDILNIYLKKTKFDSKIDLEKFASKTTGMSGADLENLVNTAAIMAAKFGRAKVTTDDMELAYDRLVLGIENKTLHKIIPEEEKLRTAIHELGHAFVGFEKNKKEIHKVTIIPRGKTLGVTHTIGKDNVSQSKSDLVNMIDIALGGTIAEEVFYGENEVSTGASSDLQRVTQIAREMVTRLGMSDLGKVDFTPQGRQGEQLVSPETTRQVDQEIQRLVAERYELTKLLIKRRKSEIEKIAHMLVKYETLSGAEIQDLLNGKEIRASGAPMKF
jgi:ATP-dependent metalloprotease